MTPSHETPNLTRRSMAASLTASGFTGLAAMLAPNAEAASIARTDLANALGFWPVLSETSPTTIKMGNIPVIWFPRVGDDDTITASQLPPVFDDQIARYTIPSGVEGVQYKNKDTGAVIKEDSMTVVSGSLPQTVTIIAEALPGYSLNSNNASSWTHVFIDPSKVSLVFTDTFSGSPNTGLNKRNADNQLGGSTQTTWNNYTGSEAFQIDNSFDLVNTANIGAYKVDTGTKDMRMAFEFDWINANNATQSATFTIGGTTNGGGITLEVTNNECKVEISTKNGTQTIFDTIGSGTVPNGMYIMEIVGNQFGIKTPDMKNMTYIDISYMDDAHGINQDTRGSFTLIGSNITTANTFKLRNFSISKIGS